MSWCGVETRTVTIPPKSTEWAHRRRFRFCMMICLLLTWSHAFMFVFARFSVQQQISGGTVSLESVLVSSAARRQVELKHFVWARWPLLLVIKWQEMSATIKVLRLDTEVDPVFACRLCSARPYADANNKIRTKDPASPSRPLCWVSHRFCENCHIVVLVSFRYDFEQGGRFEGLNISSVIKKIQVSMLRTF